MTTKQSRKAVGSKQEPIAAARNIEKQILLIRGEKVMLDSDLAALYAVETKVLIQAVKRNISRFPWDFMFQLTNQEVNSLRSHFEIMRAFVKLRQILASHAELAKKLEALERKYDKQFKVVFEAIRQLMTPPEPTQKNRIGFIWNNKK